MKSIRKLDKGESKNKAMSKYTQCKLVIFAKCNGEIQ
jgi:hypothetical protein